MGDTTTSTAAAALGSSGDAATAPVVAAEDHHHDEVVLPRHDGNGNGNGNGDGGGGGGGSALSVNNSAEEDNKTGGNVENGSDRSNNCGGNRWPRPETLALLKIRSDMDATFRDSSLKAPLWEEVSRKLAELGYKRSAKKCKEKFENVYKYHKRTKDGRTGKSDGKTYRFFDQIEAFDHQNHHPPPPSPQKPQQAISTSTTTTPTPWTTNLPISTSSVSHNIFATRNPTINNNSLPILPHTIITKSMITDTTTTTTTKNNNGNGLVFSSPTSSSTASDEEFQARHKRKRKWRDFFRRLTREVVRKQEEMQKRFLETVAKCENERTAREEAWRLQEMARINREHEILLQERSAAAAKDAAVITFLQKISGLTTHNFPISVNNTLSVCDNNRSNNNNNSAPTAPPPPPPPPAAAPASFEKTNATTPPQPPPPLSLGNLRTSSSSNSSSRWPKAEVEELINLRTNLDLKYQDNMPKGPLWEEISAGMRELGYNRSAKRCKEKWENINKYFKKVKDNNKKRAEDSKTCPYFHKLDAIYRERSKMVDQKPRENGAVVLEKGVAPPSASPPPLPLPHLGMEPLMVQPERQWPLQVGNDTALDEEDEEEGYQEDEEDHRDTSSSTEMEQDHHNDRPKGNGDGSYGLDSNLQSSINMVE